MRTLSIKGGSRASIYIHEEVIGTGRGAGNRDRMNRQLEQVIGNQDTYDFGRQKHSRKFTLTLLWFIQRAHKAYGICCIYLVELCTGI